MHKFAWVLPQIFGDNVGMQIIRRVDNTDISELLLVRSSVEDTATLGQLGLLGMAPKELRAMLDSGEAGAWVCLIGARLVGFVIARVPVGDIVALSVRPEVANLNIGKQLLTTAEAWLVSRGVSRAWLKAGVATQAALFYEQCAWEQIGWEVEGLILFTKDLTSGCSYLAVR